MVKKQTAAKRVQKVKNRKIAHIIAHTHWDREWRYPLWQTRLMLVKFMDELVEALEAGIYPGFLMDGQVSPVLDYLEMRPEMRGRIENLVKSGKLEIGPWYTLPDEYPVDGEALVRNLVWGHRSAAEFGGVFNAGYTSFGWGQTAQLAQIYGGFGMDIAMIGKRVSHDRAPQCEFIWRSPDGTELLTTRFGELGRQNFYLKLHMSALLGVNWETNDWQRMGLRTGITYHASDRDQMEQDHVRIDPPATFYPEMITPQRIESLWDTMAESVLADDRLMMNGCDYTAAQPLFVKILTRIQDVDPDKGRRWIQTTMTQYVELMRQKIDRKKLVVVHGELRDGPAINMTGNALATRMHIKRLNKQAQNLLIRVAEPLSVIAAMLGDTGLDPFVRTAWQYLLHSHPHDSINGVTQDKTVYDVENRLRQVIDLSQTVCDHSLRQIVKNIDLGTFLPEDVLMIVFNPLPYDRDAILEAWINMPEAEESGVLISPPDGLQVYQADGKAVDTQWLGSTKESYPVAESHSRPFGFSCQRHRVIFRTGTVPACGYKVFKAGAVDDNLVKGIHWNDSSARTATLLKSPNLLENEYLQVRMNGNGTFDLTDKRCKTTFYNLNYYEDRGEHGTYWFNERPMFDKSFTTLGCAALIWSQEAGSLQATLVSEVVIPLPSRGIRAEHRRGDERVNMTIRTSVTLRAGQDMVEVKVEFENRHEDHYLRAMFPTGLANAACADAGGHFIVDRRPIRPQGPTAESVWPDMATLPQNNFVDVSDGSVGIAFLNDTLTEYEVMDNQERTVALSLLRSVQNWICTERIPSVYPSQKGGQCLGVHSYRYAIMPHAGNWRDANIPLAAERFNIPCRPVQTNGHHGILPGGRHSFVAIDNPALRFSCLKKTEDRPTITLRLYNPTDSRQQAAIRFAAPVIKAWETNLNEKRIRSLEMCEHTNTIKVCAGSNKIITIEAELKIAHS